MKLPAMAKTPMLSDYKPELNATEKLDANNITMFQELIGELRWATEIGRIDILHDLLLVSAFQETPRDIQLHQVFHRFFL